MKQKHKRRMYPVINRSHQYRFLAIILSYNMLIVAYLVVCIFLPDILQLQNESLSFEIRAAAADRMLSLHSRIWPGIITLICLIGLHSFRVFHRFVGPLFRLTWAFQQLRDGKLNFRVKLRKKDYLHEEAALFNDMLDKLNKKLQGILDASENALKSSGELEKHEREGPAGEGSQKEIIAGLRGDLEALMEASRSFQLWDGVQINKMDK